MTSRPARCSVNAADNPAKPAPTTTTDLDANLFTPQNFLTQRRKEAKEKVARRKLQEGIQSTNQPKICGKNHSYDSPNP
jgi:hypothetical protein